MMRYEKYKPSEILWLREIPAHWNIKRTKNVLANKKYPLKTGPFGTQLKGNDLKDEGNTCVYSQRNVIDNQFDEFKYFVDDEKAKELANFYVSPNDILITTRGTIGRASKVPENALKGILHPCLITLRTNPKIINATWLLYYLNDSGIFQTYISAESGATTIEVIYSNTLSNFIQILPPLEEQTAIAQYLDTKTQAIDKKINLLTKKSETYKELRKSIINDAVCKGLDKNVKLKESGVYYINSIPVHWKVERIKDQFYIGRGRVIGQEALVENGEYPVYSSQTENNGCLGFIETFDFDKDLLTWTTDGANAGTVFRRSGKFNCTNVCGTLISKKKNLDLNYVVYALQESATHNKRIDTNGAKIMNNEMAVIHIAFPPLEEQTAIANYLDEKTQKIDAIVSNIEKQIDTLKELRKTLINDVVTGKIKVINTPT